MTALAATTGLGYAVGSSIAGRLADWGGQTPAFAVTVAAGALATLLTLAAASTLRREQDTAPVGPGTAPERPGPVTGQGSVL
jgi:MFS family permease